MASVTGQKGGIVDNPNSTLPKKQLSFYLLTISEEYFDIDAIPIPNLQIQIHHDLAFFRYHHDTPPIANAVIAMAVTRYKTQSYQKPPGNIISR